VAERRCPILLWILRPDEEVADENEEVSEEEEPAEEEEVSDEEEADERRMVARGRGQRRNGEEDEAEDEDEDEVTERRVRRVTKGPIPQRPERFVTTTCATRGEGRAIAQGGASASDRILRAGICQPHPSSGSRCSVAQTRNA
jgi:hypothetical protein